MLGRPTAAAVAGLLCLLLAAGCGGSGGDSGVDLASATPTASLEITSRALKFDKRTLVAVANTEISLRFVNDDAGVPHNVAVYTRRNGDKLFVGETFPGKATVVYRFQSPPPGDYFFRCDVHPDTMTGTFATR